ncbi:uncharacterized protein LOC104441075 [Eucalyptus grandis]|uniref:uncharacterized protein LOC104441075 n=1 Tax=Eucalyptus grandis TaxID=71139 RepID=UPI00192EA19F|nr:uncharacterized protein LOC104441075 [Eucalyptus grandis]
MEPKPLGAPNDTYILLGPTRNLSIKGGLVNRTPFPKEPRCRRPRRFRVRLVSCRCIRAAANIFSFVLPLRRAAPSPTDDGACRSASEGEGGGGVVHQPAAAWFVRRSLEFLIGKWQTHGQWFLASISWPRYNQKIQPKKGKVKILESAHRHNKTRSTKWVSLPVLTAARMNRSPRENSR